MKQLKKLLAGGIAFSLIFFQGFQLAEAKGKEEKGKKQRVVDKNKDNIADAWELKFKLGLGKDVAKKDNDKDGLSNIVEYQLNLNPTQKDTDHDKISDSDEDSDKDGLTNLQELKAKLNPALSDTDKDRIRDGQEDEDNDLLTNEQEFKIKLNPNVSDTDKDGILDGDEDLDADGLSNVVEFEVKENPLDRDSDNDGFEDGKEDWNKNGIIDANELRKLKIELVTPEDKEIKVEYEIQRNKSKSKIIDESGSFRGTSVDGFLKTITFSQDMNIADIVNQVKQTFNVENYASLEIELVFFSGKKIKFEDNKKKHEDDGNMSDGENEENDGEHEEN